MEDSATKERIRKEAGEKMPIVISRNGDGARMPAPQAITPEQRERLWEAYIRNYMTLHPELLREDEETCR